MNQTITCISTFSFQHYECPVWSKDGIRIVFMVGWGVEEGGEEGVLIRNGGKVEGEVGATTIL